MRTLPTTWSKLQIVPMKRKAKKNTRKKVENDSNAPKRPRSAFFFFMEDFTKTYPEGFPDMKARSVIQAGREKCKSMSDEEKAPRVEKAALMKAEYERACKEYTEKSNGCEVVIAPEDSWASTSSVVGYDADEEDDS